MTKKPQRQSSAAATGSVGTSDDERLQEGAGAPPSGGPASAPSGMNGPDGTNTTASETASESGDAAGTASANPVKPHDKDGTSTPVMVTDATNSQSAPEAEASASGESGDNSEPSQGDASSGGGNPAGPAGTSPERRLFLVSSAYRRGGKRRAGGRQPLTAEAHAELDDAGLVTVAWDAGEPVES